ncbi:MAG TPA: hypothetical protein VLR10_04230 [Nitrososphaeraceae archaeon]|nr:hypothetical protein [Nitrososphaeraceae archaeon]
MTTTAGLDGSLYGGGQAVLTTNHGEIVTWKGIGVGKPKGKCMAISWCGAKAKASQTSSQKLSRLNNVPLVLKLKPNGVGWPKHCERK